MAQPVANLTQASIVQLYGVFADNKTLAGTEGGVETLSELASILNRLYPVVQDITITDITDASPTAFLAGQGAGLQGAGGIFRTLGGTADFTDNALATAKGSAVATNDVFVMSSGTAVAYLGSQSATLAVPFDWSGETSTDFSSLGA